MIKVSVEWPRHSYKATARIMSEDDFNSLSILDSIEVKDEDLATKVINKYNYVRQQKNDPISLPTALYLVRLDEHWKTNLKPKRKGNDS
jgi:hypothetical protein